MINSMKNREFTLILEPLLLRLFLIYDTIRYLRFQFAALDGEVAVPCDPQPAVVGLNSHPRQHLVGSVFYK